MTCLLNPGGNLFYLRVHRSGQKYWVTDFSNKGFTFHPAPERRITFTQPEAKVIMGKLTAHDPEIQVFSVPVV